MNLKLEFLNYFTKICTNRSNVMVELLRALGQLEYTRYTDIDILNKPKLCLLCNYLPFQALK